MKHVALALVLVAVAAVMAGSGAAGGAATAGPARQAALVVPPRMTCERLAAEGVAALPDEAGQIETATVVAADGATPEFCHVTGHVAPQIEFELRLPTETWTGRYLQIGCGGCDSPADLDAKLRQEGHLGGCIPGNLGEFVLASNVGHAGLRAAWAENAPQPRIDWGYRSEHVLATASKAIVTTFYGQAPQHAYFAGCSNGGRQALMLAQRFPEDFDGIIAGAPANAMPAIMLTLAWNARANTAADGGPILTADTLPLLHRAAMAECDGRDGLVDGQIDDPRECRFDPAGLQCPDGQAGAGCLTPAQVETARKLYAGPVDEQGGRLYPGGLPAGSELEWRAWLHGFAPGGPGIAETLAQSYLSYQATWAEPLSLDSLRFDRATFERLAQMSPIYDATDPDLRAFRDRGGKLILWHGWNDPAASPLGTLAYHQAVQDAIGGLDETQRFARLYLFPGAGHCDGTRSATFDLVSPLLEWVEQGVAPEGVTTTWEQDGQVARTRPVFPYPTVTRYGGSGSVDDATNFVAAPPVTPPADRIEWAGGYRSGYQEWCAWQGATLVCRRDRPDRP